MLKVLVVDDEPTIATLLAEIVEEFGYEVTVAFDGRQGYELAKGGKFSLMISDMMMPYLKGNELCLRLKQEPLAQKTCIVLMSAVPQMIQLSQSCQADAFILKPFDISAIHQILERFLSKPDNNPHSLSRPNIENLPYFTP